MDVTNDIFYSRDSRGCDKMACHSQLKYPVESNSIPDIRCVKWYPCHSRDIFPLNQNKRQVLQ